MFMDIRKLSPMAQQRYHCWLVPYSGMIAYVSIEMQP